MTRELLLKFLDNRCSHEELKKIIQWIGKGALSEKSKNYAYNDWKSFIKKEQSESHNERFNQILDKIHHKINIKSSLKSGSSPKERVHLITKWVTRAAAILLIPVLTFLLYILSNPSFISSHFADSVVDSLEIIAPAGSRTVVQLTDGTTVHLNNGSKIKYPGNFNGKNRELTLTGEGYFEVAHDSKHPFIVKTKYLNVKALGTQFNVMTYPDDDIVATTLVEGKVVLEKSDKNGKIKSIGALVPGQHVDYNVKTGTVSGTKGNIEKYTAWKDGLLIFDNSGINEVAERLGHMFNAEIKVSAEIKDYTYTVKFVDESLSQILELITKATPVDYKILPRERLPDGTFSKQIILLGKRQN